MSLRPLAVVLLACCLATVADCPAAEETGEPSIRYLPLDAPPGMSQAVIVQGLPLVHTRQLLPLDREGKLVGEGSADRQIEQVLANLEAVLKDSGSGMDKLVRVNVYALSTAIVSSFREHLTKRLGAGVRPAITSVLTPLAHRKALVAVDAVAGAADSGKAVALKRCPSVAGDERCADAAVLPRGGIAYLSGQPDEAGLTESAVTRSMSDLMRTLGHLNLSPKQVVQVKVFLRPVTSAEEVLREVQKFFPGQITPPVIFVEWLAAVPVEIEMIAQFPLSGKPAKDVEYFTPPEVRPSNTFSKVALLETDRQIYLSGLYARVPSRGEPQALYVFGQLQEILTKTGSDLRHLVKATYYVTDHDAARWIDRTRPRFYDPTCPPAASKVMVHGVGQAHRTMTVDMIAVGSTRVAKKKATAAPQPGGEKRPTKIWNRTGPLGKTPKRVTDAYPLSDQENKGKWVKFEPMTDEFEGKELDRAKWTVGMYWWKGRQPALFSDKNVTVSDGKLHLTMRKENLPPEAERLGYKDYTSAALHSKARSSYGYYEVKAKPMNSAGSSSFWFQQDETPGWGTEIDVFEIGAKAKGFEHKYHMTLHVTRTPWEKKHWSVGGIWIAPWRLADDYHVYGFDWGKDELKFYVDGVLVRSVENTHWHQPLYLIFDSETMPKWFGMPDDKDLPSTFSVEYVRAWKRGQ